MLPKNLGESYEVTEDKLIAESTCGVIYAVKKKNSDDTTTYALKTVQTHVLGNKNSFLEDEKVTFYADLLRKEIAIFCDLTQELGSLEKNHIIPMLDHGVWYVSDTQNNEPCFIMPRGSSSLRDLAFKDYFPCNLQLWCIYATQLLTALNALSQTRKETKLQSHRDIKPENIILWNDKLYLIDFGIGRAKDAGHTTFVGWGSKKWFAPEQGIPHSFGPHPKDGKRCPYFHAGPPVDVYSIAHILYWICVKRYLISQDKISSLYNEGKPSETAVNSFEKVGGISESEIERFKAALLQLHKKTAHEPDGTIVTYSADNALPNIDRIINDIASLLKSMLEIKAGDRATAPEAFQTIKAIQARFNPKIEKIEIQGPQTEIYCNHAYALTITISGEGLEEDNFWWELLIDDKKIEDIVFKHKDLNSFVWIASCPAINIDGSATCSLNAFIGLEKKSITKTVHVIMHLEDLWKNKRYIEALKKDPERAAWLAQIRKETKRSLKNRKKWIEIMDTVHDSLRDTDKYKTCDTFKALYYSLKSQAKEDALNKKSNKGLKRAFVIALILGALWKVGDAIKDTPDEEVVKPQAPIIEKEKQDTTSVTDSVAVKSQDTPDEKGVGESQKPKTFALTVNTTPANARVRILNIVPVYHDGIQLKNGTYQIEVSADGYETITEYVAINGKDAVKYIYLEEFSKDYYLKLADAFRMQGSYQSAFPLYKQAAEDSASESGNAEAQFWLAWCYETGKGVTQNRETALEWYLAAATQGHAESQYKVGVLYEEGDNDAKDLKKAREWYEKAATQGHIYAKARLEELQKPKTFTLTINTTPVNARVSFKDRTITYHDGIALKQGTYHIVVSATGYESAETSIRISNRNIIESITLKSKPTPIQLVQQADLYDAQKAYDMALPLYKKAASFGNADAQFMVGKYYELGRWVIKNKEQAVIWYTKSAEQKNERAKARLEELQKPKTYALTINTTPSNARVRIMNIDPVYHDGIQLKKGEYKIKVDAKGYEDVTRYVTINDKDVIDHIALKKKTIAPQKKSIDDILDQAHHLRYTVGDYTNAFLLYIDAAKAGNAEAQWSVGFSYFYGEGVMKNEIEAAKWFTKSADQGYAAGQYFLGTCYLYGIGVTKNEKKAVEWYIKGAKQGNAGAQHSLASCYQDGIGVKKNEEAAIIWYTRAADHGLARSQCQLGYCYRHGIGVDSDDKKAVKFYTLAANQNFDVAQYNLGMCYYYGWGVDEDENKAIEWFKKAARQGYKVAQDKLRKLDETW